MPDLLLWLEAEHRAAQQTYRDQRNPYHEGMVDALDRVIARVKNLAPSSDWRDAFRCDVVDGMRVRVKTNSTNETVEGEAHSCSADKFRIGEWNFTRAGLSARRPVEIWSATNSELTAALDAMEGK